FNGIAHDLMEFYSERGEKVLLIDLDPEIHQHFQTDKNHNAVPLYADMDDPDVWKEFHFDKAKIVISCMVRGQEAEIAIARWIKERNPDVLFVATTDSQEEALELYESGVDYVIQTEFLAAEITREIFTRELAKGRDAFKELAQIHQGKIKEQQRKIEPIFRLL
ncbi:MAG: NAD-binding protein, partial [SAR324 cluster bacterium]|nr:NAD-binding protein [SAR324 cluster bacterium]